MRIADLADRRVAVWGYGREGRAACAALRLRLPNVPFTVFCSELEAQALRRDFDPGSASERDQEITCITAPPDAADLSAFDVVIKSPGISAYRAEILEAQHNGVLFTSGTALWFAENPAARVIAVTGTKGKSTVSALIAHLLRSLGRRTALAGNIGLPLLELLDPPVAPDWWAIELSSFQTRSAPRADIGVIVNLYEEHLDWHGTRERYASDKMALADVAQTLIVNAGQTEVMTRAATHPRRKLFDDAGTWHVRNGAIFCGDMRELDVERLPLIGAHNALNVCAALAAVDAAGEDAMAAREHIASFRPLPHRLQELGERDGLTWIDDSIATTPQATLEALASFPDRDVTLLVGGYERALDWHPFAAEMSRHPPFAIVTFGAIGARIADLLRRHANGCRTESVSTLADAVSMARTITPRHGIVLLSPGAPSFDEFRDYAERGRAFATLAGFDGAAIGEITGLGIA